MNPALRKSLYPEAALFREPDRAEIVRLLAEERDAVRFEAHRIGARGDGVELLDVLRASALGAVRLEDPHRVEHVELRLEERLEIDDALGKSLVHEIPRAPGDPHEILHHERHAAEAVMLRDRHVDDLVRVERAAEQRPILENLAAQVRFYVMAILDEEDLGAGLLGRVLDAAPLVGAPRVVARVVRHDDLLRAGLERHGDECRDDERIRVGGLLLRAVPADVRLHEDDVPARDERAHPADEIDRLARDERRIVPLDDRHRVLFLLALRRGLRVLLDGESGELPLGNEEPRGAHREPGEEFSSIEHLCYRPFSLMVCMHMAEIGTWRIIPAARLFRTIIFVHL